MKLTQFYDKDASTNWFTTRHQKLSVHEYLSENNFHVFDNASLQHECKHVEVPVSFVNLSWGGSVPRPKNLSANAYIARELYDLKNDVYKSQTLANTLSAWMQEKLTGTKYLISLNPAQYLVATASDITFEDVFAVTRTWDIDSWVGVFDESGSMSFIFDVEFWVTMISCKPSMLSDEMRAFFKTYNDEFNEIFVRDNHLLSHADPERTQEYFDKVFSPLGALG